MQTFLPFEDFAKSAKVLDYRRLGKQRVECYQILNILVGSNHDAKWKNHPAVLMWKGYEAFLCAYTLYIITEWENRGYKDTIRNKISEFYTYTIDELGHIDPPWWLGKPEFHKSHQSNLLRKDLEYYRKYFPDVPDNLPYIWPVTKEGICKALIQSFQ